MHRKISADKTRGGIGTEAIVPAGIRMAVAGTGVVANRQKKSRNSAGELISSVIVVPRDR